MTDRPPFVVTLSARAVADLAAIRAYIAGEGAPLAAERLGLRLETAIFSLAENPDRGRPAGPGFRELTIVRPYVARYRVRGRAVEIVYVKHGARDPNAA